MKKIGIIIFAVAIVVGVGISNILSIEGFSFKSPVTFSFGSKVKGSGNVITEKRDVAEFNKIDVGSNFRVEVVAQKETITFDDFSKLDMRVGTIIEAEKMPKAKKLLVLKVDTGLDTRTIVSGIAESFKPEEIVGKKVTVLVNLAPRALRGVESEGMILMAENAEGKLVFVNPDEEGVSSGETIN